MGLFSDLEAQAKELYDSKRSEIGKLTGDFFGEILSNAKKPATSSQPAQAATPTVAAVQAAVPYMKYAIPAVAIVGAALLFKKRG